MYPTWPWVWHHTPYIAHPTSCRDGKWSKSFIWAFKYFALWAAWRRSHPNGLLGQFGLANCFVRIRNELGQRGAKCSGIDISFSASTSVEEPKRISLSLKFPSCCLFYHPCPTRPCSQCMCKRATLLTSWRYGTGTQRGCGPPLSMGHTSQGADGDLGWALFTSSSKAETMHGLWGQQKGRFAPCTYRK